VITQRLREAERESQFNRFSRQENEIIIATVQSVAPQSVTLHLERTEEAHMPRREQIPGERYSLHQKIRVYVVEVRRTPRGPDIIVSRSHPLMLRRLLELEVPEIRAGQVDVNAVAREAGTRAKVAVSARQAGIDPVGACVGMRGIRIQTISRELHGERIDVLEWSEDPAVFISNALSVPSIVSVTLDEHNPGGRTASVVVLDEHLSLAIGRSGQNARLAAKLTSWRVDIQGATEAALSVLEQVNQTPELLEALRGTAALIPRLAAVMRTHEKEQYPYTDEERSIIGTVINAVRLAVIARREAERPGSVQARARQREQNRVDEERIKAKEEAQARVPRGAYKIQLSDLELPEKIYSHLVTNGLENLGQVMERMALGDEALLMLNGVGVKGLRDIKQAVEETGLGLLDHGELEVEVDLAETAEDEAPALLDDVAFETEEADTFETEPELDTLITEAEEVTDADSVSVPVAFEAGALDDEEVRVPEMASEAADAGVVEAEAEDAEVEPVEVVEEPSVESLLDMPVGLGAVVYDEVEEEDLGAEDSSPGGRTRREGRKQRRRQVVFDDTTGQTFVVRKHRRRSADGWTDFSEDI
jgi:transcription termination/antitermination protein NusA